MANYMMVRHSVQDHSEWKKDYNAHELVRAAAVLVVTGLKQSSRARIRLARPRSVRRTFISTSKAKPTDSFRKCFPQ